MIEPLNYLRQAQEDLARVWFPFAQERHPQDAENGRTLLEAARGAPKFILPRGGRLLNDALRGLPREPRLPFQTLVLEYQSDAEGQGIVEQVYDRKPVSCPRRVVVAWQDGTSIFVQALFCMLSGERYVWTVTPYVAELCCDETQEPAAAPTYYGKPVLPHLLDKAALAGHLSLRFHAVGTIAEQSCADWRGSAYLDMLDEVNAVLELIEALSCSNVRHEALPVRKLNKSASKRGALPFDEYRVLTVRSPGGDEEQAAARAAAALHRSPREHLRRGHIRIYESGKRIWINPTLVNAGVGGKISTVRDMRRAA